MAKKTPTKPPYLDLNTYLKKRFGQRVQKIPIDAGLFCPNRDGTKGTGGCIYCDPRGSGTGAYKKGLSIKEQIERGMLWAKKRYKAKLFIAYFQAFSNTYAPVERLKKIYSQALLYPEIVGISIGTRPDCIDKEKLELISELAKDKMVWMEYGLQSASNKTLEFINRHSTVEDFIEAIKLTKQYKLLTCAHIIFGLPNETVKDMINTVKLLCDLKIDGVKFHQLYVLKGTKMEELYNKGQYEPIDIELYTDLVAKAIKMLPKDTVIQRISADPPRGELICPLWSFKKQEIKNKIWEKLNQ